MSAKKAKSAKKKSLTSYPVSRIKTPVNKQSKKARPKKPKKIYTYILKDVERDIFKIGKTTSPVSRFRNLCKRGVVMPLALAEENIESMLHDMFAENRTEHPDYKHNGATEWFTRGGKFDDFINKFDESVFLPYITPHEMVVEFIEKGIIKTDGVSTAWEIEQNIYSYYYIGLEILRITGFIQRKNLSAVVDNSPDVSKFDSKIMVSDKVLKTIEDSKLFFISAERYSHIIKSNAKKEYGSRLRSVRVKDGSGECELYLLMNDKELYKNNKA